MNDFNLQEAIGWAGCWVVEVSDYREICIFMTRLLSVLFGGRNDCVHGFPTT